MLMSRKQEKSVTTQYISLADYFMGRREMYPMAMTPAIAANASLTVELVNKVMEKAAAAGVSIDKKPDSKYGCIASGWRPPAVNASTVNAAPNSKHMTGEAVDVYDPDGDLDDWLMTDEGQKALAEIGMWMEHPAATKGWSHLQTRPPRSGKRVYYP